MSMTRETNRKVLKEQNNREKGRRRRKGKNQLTQMERHSETLSAMNTDPGTNVLSDWETVAMQLHQDNQQAHWQTCDWESEQVPAVSHFPWRWGGGQWKKDNDVMRDTISGLKELGHYD